MKKTAVEWLVDKVEDHFCLLPVDLIEQAKEMEKEEMKEFYQDGFFIPFPSDATFEQIYKEKYETDSNTTRH